MKKFKLLSLLTAAAISASCVAGLAISASANYSDVDGVITWDFGEYTDTVYMAPYDDEPEREYQTEIQYEGLTLVGNPSSSNGDYVSASAKFHMNGTSASNRRYIKYTPVNDGKLTVTFRSNSKNDTNPVVDRWTGIGTAVVTNADPTTLGSELLAYEFTYNSDDKTVSADLKAGNTYYAFFGNGGQTIRELKYEYTISGEVDPPTDPDPVDPPTGPITYKFGTATSGSIANNEPVVFDDYLTYIPSSGSGSSSAYDKGATFDDGFTSDNRIKLGGGSTFNTSRVFEFIPPTAGTVKVYFAGGGSGTRSCVIKQDGKEDVTVPSVDSEKAIATAEVAATTPVYIGGDNNIGIYGIVFTPSTTAEPEETEDVAFTFSSKAESVIGKSVTVTVNGDTKTGTIGELPTTFTGYSELMLALVLTNVPKDAEVSIVID